MNVDVNSGCEDDEKDDFFEARHTAQLSIKALRPNNSPNTEGLDAAFGQPEVISRCIRWLFHSNSSPAHLSLQDSILAHLSKYETRYSPARQASDGGLHSLRASPPDTFELDRRFSITQPLGAMKSNLLVTRSERNLSR